MMSNLGGGLKVVLVFLALIALCGCVDYEEQTYLNEDMSGSIDISLSIDPRQAMAIIMAKVEAQRQSPIAGPKPLMSDLEDKARFNWGSELKEDDFTDAFNISAIKKKSYKKYEKDGKLFVVLTVEFDDIRKLFEGKKNVTVTTNKDGSITYTEYFEPTAEQKNKDTAENKEFLKESRFRYVMHMPRDIISANTGMIDKNKAEWDLPLTAAYAKDFYITATMKGENKLLGLLKRFKRK